MFQIEFLRSIKLLDYKSVLIRFEIFAENAFFPDA